MKSFIFILLFLSFSSFLNAQTGHSSNNLQKVSLQLHWKYQFEFAGFIAAKEKGFYRDAGLDVQLKEYQTGMNVVDEVLSHRADFGIYNSSILLEYLKGKPIVLLASFFKRSALVLITQPYIHSPKDLVGKTVMSSLVDDFALNFKPYLDGYGVNINDIKMVNQTYRVDEFAKGEVDAMTAFVSDQPYKLDKLGIKYNILNPSNDNLFVLQEELFTSADELKNHPQQVYAFKEASIKGWEYALSHRKEIAQIIKKKYAPQLDMDTLEYEAEAINKLILPFIYDIGSIDRNFLNKQIQLFKSNFHIGEGKSLDDFILKPRINKLDLTETEQKYIETHQKIPMCINYDFFPIDGFKDGKHIGIMADVFKLISNETGLKFIPLESQSEKGLYEHLQEKRCKLLSVVATDNVHFSTIKPTKSFSATNFTLLSRLDRSFIDNPMLLKGKLLLVQKESFKNYLNYLYPYLNIEVEDNKNIMVQKILDGKAYSIASIDEQADYFIDKYGYGKLKINGFLAKDKLLHGSIGVQKDEPVLYSIIQKALDNIPKQKIESIQNSWRLTRYHERVDYILLWAVLGVVSVIFLIMIYYQRKLKYFNKALEKRVAQKTKELQEANELLEHKVQKKAQELIKKDEILTSQSKQAVMGEMISMIAHQWRQPLNTITLQVSNLQLKYMMGQEILKEEVMQTLEDISNSIVYLSDTIDDFKTYFHPNKTPEDIALESLLNKAVKFILPRLKSNKIELKIECDSSIHVHVYINELIQVLLNILNNAVDVYENRNMDDKIITIICKKSGLNVQINITDRAGGISDEHLPKLFEPYFSTKGKNGTGLGLYMSKMIIEKQFGGSISVKSSIFGTTFTLVIPKDIQKK
ncbi:ABC transporter substrate-binding protein [Sulfurimonas autotrophica]|uniref:histidine kinase n=1 Tax=Sulfurimonas autotrophica (strain ATCC BAA-671 / DSM 16294 / JCM 11897 / OK10) TaxID=563040 RepID=E0US11_SULAO|nr:ABC transporter substrate-binding protein [Sulfurimonas autotrophica]ADN09034.1 histidine kinase [Sulfurimonas autotrophica DSM 16294]